MQAAFFNYELEQGQMTFQAIRAHIETKVNDAFQALVPPIEVMFDNVQETPPALPYVVCLDRLTPTPP